MATHSSILAWEIPWTEKPGGLWFMGSQRETTEATEHSTQGLTGAILLFSGCFVVIPFYLCGRLSCDLMIWGY